MKLFPAHANQEGKGYDLDVWQLKIQAGNIMWTTKQWKKIFLMLTATIPNEMIIDMNYVPQNTGAAFIRKKLQNIDKERQTDRH